MKPKDLVQVRLGVADTAVASPTEDPGTGYRAGVAQATVPTTGYTHYPVPTTRYPPPRYTHYPVPTTGYPTTRVAHRIRGIRALTGQQN